MAPDPAADDTLGNSLIPIVNKLQDIFAQVCSLCRVLCFQQASACLLAAYVCVLLQPLLVSTRA